MERPPCRQQCSAQTSSVSTKAEGGRVVAIGTTVVRALEAAANLDGRLRAGDSVARGRVRRETQLRVVDAVLTGVHEPGESHLELLPAFADDMALTEFPQSSRSTATALMSSAIPC